MIDDGNPPGVIIQVIEKRDLPNLKACSLNDITSYF
jgi:hypothetical protein